jgi:hypothetical protein
MVRPALGIALLLLAAVPLTAQEPTRVDGWVVLPVSDYLDLRARAFPAPPDPSPPPVDSVLTRVDYDLRAGGDVATGQARLTVDVLKEGWVSVQVPQGLMVRNARLDGRPAPLVSGSPPRMLISRAGRSLIALDIVVPLASNAGVESMTLPSSGAAVSAVRLTVPRTNVDLASTGGIVTGRAETASESRWTVHGTPSRPLSFSWKRRVEDRRDAMPLRTRARITQLVSLGEETSLVNASVQSEVVQGTARQVVIAVPGGLAVNQVSGPAVSDWTQDAGTLTVSLIEPTTTETTIAIAAEIKLPRDGAVSIPIVGVPDADRETGGIAVDVLGAGEIGTPRASGLEPADPSELGGIIAGRETPSMAAFRFGPLETGTVRALSVELARYSARPVLIANIEEARYDVVMGEDGKSLVRARYAMRNNQRAFLAATLPQGAALWSATLAGQPVRPGMSASGALLLPLQKGPTGEDAPMFGVELIYLHRDSAWTDKGRTTIEVPTLDLPVSRTGLTLHHSPRYRIEVLPGAFRVENDPGPVSGVLRREDAIAMALTPAAPPPPEPDASGLATQTLIDKLRKESGRRVPGVVPVQLQLPDFGLPLFVAAELTPEGHAPMLDIEHRWNGDR